MIDHLSFRVRNLARSRDFYAQALAPLGYTPQREVTPEMRAGFVGVAFGRDGMPSLWLSEGEPSGSLHLGLVARDRKAVDAFHAAALRAGGKDNGAPGVRAIYHPNYYGAFVFDPDGNNLEAVCHAPVQT